MANKKEEAIKTIKPEELSIEVIKTKMQEDVDYYNKLIAERERLLGELQKVEAALSEKRGSIHTLQRLQNDYAVEDIPSVNGKS
tara:strand:+ start:521 stop:772 length:252 start_codon:yes stop_codon:yes gene_type:complete